MIRIGEGYDSHRLVEGRRLRIGCVDVPFDKGSLGHSDGDAAAHAVCDALLGALALGDIGTHFPPHDVRWEGVDSRVFLREVARLVGERGGRIGNVDVTVVLERPRLATHIGDMRAAIAEALGIDAGSVSVKAKSAEGIGPVGRGEIVEARAVALVEVS